MPVAKRDIDELLTVIKEYVPADRVNALLSALRQTQAAKTNKSFAETMWRLFVLSVETSNRGDPGPKS